MIADLPVIELSHVSKRFELRHEQVTTFKDWALGWVSGRHQTSKRESFLALDDINLRIHRGEVVGILGLNGSGKSTLLRLVAQTLKPTEGTVSIRGKVTPLLSLGLGFHPEMTGQENLILMCSIYGLSHSEINRIYLNVVDFAELEKFIDVPLKKYSSGMRVRLAFSIATHLNPDILVIDEVLAVGDKEFRDKSRNHIFELKRQGKTVLIASHSMLLIQKFCSTACLLEKGHLMKFGPVEEVIEAYQTNKIKPHTARNRGDVVSV